MIVLEESKFNQWHTCSVSKCAMEDIAIMRVYCEESFQFGEWYCVFSKFWFKYHDDYIAFC